MNLASQQRPAGFQNSQASGRGPLPELVLPFSGRAWKGASPRAQRRAWEAMTTGLQQDFQPSHSGTRVPSATRTVHGLNLPRMSVGVHESPPPAPCRGIQTSLCGVLATSSMPLKRFRLTTFHYRGFGKCRRHEHTRMVVYNSSKGNPQR